jgi:hypothetical protein
MFEAIKWPADMVPSRSPIHFTSELEVEISPETIGSLLVETANWPLFYPGVQEVVLLDGHEALQANTRFETNLAGQSWGLPAGRFGTPGRGVGDFVAASRVASMSSVGLFAPIGEVDTKSAPGPVRVSRTDRRSDRSCP